MPEELLTLTESQAPHFCTQLWLELTIAGRSIWSDPDLPSAIQLNCLKWLNEIQHRVWTTHSQLSAERLAVLLDQITAACEQAPQLAPSVNFALQQATTAAQAHHHPIEADGAHPITRRYAAENLLAFAYPTDCATRITLTPRSSSPRAQCMRRCTRN